MTVILQRLAEYWNPQVSGNRQSSGALGWVAFVSIGCIYALIPKLFDKPRMHSIKAIDLHFWVATIGVVLFTVSMWIAGVMQGLMWRAMEPDGTLTYSFIESVEASYPYYGARLLGGLLFLVGMLIMAWNVWRTLAGPSAAGATSPALQQGSAHA